MSAGTLHVYPMILQDCGFLEKRPCYETSEALQKPQLTFTKHLQPVTQLVNTLEAFEMYVWICIYEEMDCRVALRRNTVPILARLLISLRRLANQL